MRPDTQIIDSLRELWNTEDFIFDAEYSTETDRPNKYFGKICNIRNSNGNPLIHPGFNTPLFFNLWKQLNIEPGHCRIKISLRERDYRERSGWEYEFKFSLLSNRIENTSIVTELKRRWKLRDEYFIGIIHIEDKTNRYYVNDIRRSDFSKITAKIEVNGEQSPLTIRGDATYLQLQINNRYYKFSWRLHKSSTLDAPKFWIDTQKPVVLFEPQQFISRIERTHVESTVTDSAIALHPAIKSLQADWKDKTFIMVGVYSFDKEAGSYQFEDIRSITFTPRTYLDDSEIIIKLSRPIHNLELNKYYSFKWTVVDDASDRGYRIKLTPNTTFNPIEPKALVDSLYRVWDKNSADAADQMKDTMKMVSTQLTASSDGTFVYELLQNANDYPVQINGIDQRVDVEFYLTDNYLIYRHSGDYFSPRNIAAISKIAAGEKAKKKNAIGYKGIGFKTIFTDNNYVYLSSGDYSLRFDESAKKSRYNPWQIMPIWTEPDELDSEIRSIIRTKRDEFRVQMAIRPVDKNVLRSGEKNYEFIFNDIFKDERDIAFIPNIHSVRVYKDGQLIIDCKKSSSHWLITESPYEYVFTPEEIEENNDEVFRNKRIPEKYKDFADTRISFACNRNGNILLPVSDSKIYCYLPTQISLGLPFLMNTDMIPTGPRDDIEKKIQFNHKIIKIAGSKLIDWICDLLKGQRFDLDSVYSLIPSFEEVANYEDFIEEFQEGFDEAIAEASIIPVLDAKSYECHPIADVIYDTTGISEAGIMSDEEIINFIGWSEYVEFFPHPSLRGKVNFSSFMEKYHDESQELDMSKLLDMFDSDDFKTWLKTPYNNTRFIEFLLANNHFEKVVSQNKPLFIGDDGELYAAEDLYKDVDAYLYDLECFAYKWLPRLSMDTRNHFEKDESWDEQTADIFKEFDSDTFVSDIMDDAESMELMKNAENSYRFMHFLAMEDVSNDNLTTLPFINAVGTLVDNYDGLTYFESERGEEVKQMSWMNPVWIEFLSNDYLSRDAETCKKYLTKNLCVNDYSDKAIVLSIILDSDYEEDINNKLQEIDASLAFVNFAAENEKDIKDGALSEFNLHFNTKGGESVYGKSETDSFFHSPEYENYDLLSWVPDRWLFSLDEKFLAGLSGDMLSARKAFITRAFGVRELTKAIFVKEILLKKIKDIEESLDEIDTNVSFWRWIKSNCSEKASEFKTQKVLIIKTDSVEGLSEASGKNMYVSDAYLPDNKGLQSIVSTYDSSAEFIRPDYLENTTATCQKEWSAFWNSIGIKVKISELIFSYIIPKLSSIEDVNLPGLLADVRDEFKDHNITPQSLILLKLKCSDDKFRSIGSCTLINCSSSVDEPFPMLQINNECKLYRHNSDIWRLLIDIAERTSCKVISNLQDWRGVKIEQYLSLQSTGKVEEDLHFDFIEELLKINDDDRKDLKRLSEITLLNREGVMKSPSELTLGSIYEPYCDFEKFNLELLYINDGYASLNCEKVTSQLLSVFPKLHARFKESDIKYLDNVQFAMFFWDSYLTRKSANLDLVKKWIENKSFAGKKCIPASDGHVYCAEELYSLSRLGNEKDTERDYSKQIIDSAKSFPYRKFKPEIYGLFNEMKFRTSLHFDDALYALRMTSSKSKRYDLLRWMVDEYDESNEEQKAAIRTYREDEKAVWKNGRGKAEHISKLYALDIGKDAKMLEQYFKTSPLVIDKDYFPTVDTTLFAKECSMLNIPVVKRSDMEFIPEVDETVDNNKLQQQLRNYLLLVAAIESSTEWVERFNQLREKFDKLSIVKCLSISLANKLYPELSQKTRQFDCQEDTLYYVGQYSNPLVFADFVAELGEKLDSGLDKDMFRLIFYPKNIDEFNEFVNEYCADLSDDEQFRTTLSERLNLTLNAAEQESGVEEYNEDDTVTDIPRVIDSMPVCREEDEPAETEEDATTSPASSSNTSTSSETAAAEPANVIKPNVGRPTTIETHTPTAPAKIESVGVDIQDEDDDEDDEVYDRTSGVGQSSQSQNQQPITPNRTTPRGAYKGQWKQAASDTPAVRQRRNYSGYAPDKFKARTFNPGEQTPTTLSRRDPDQSEVNYINSLLGKAFNVDTIKDENYIVRMRFYNKLRENGLEPTVSEREFIENRIERIETTGGKYIHRCSARSGILYVSPTVWNRLREGRWVICFYSGKMADDFVFIRTQDELMRIINQDAVVIQVTGNDKKELIDKIYEDGFYGMDGNIYTLIRTIKVEGEVTPFDENVTDFYDDEDDNDTDAL